MKQAEMMFDTAISTQDLCAALQEIGNKLINITPDDIAFLASEDIEFLEGMIAIVDDLF